MKTLVFAESKRFVNEINKVISSLEGEIIISSDWGGCAALLSAYHFSAVIINLRPSEYGGSLDLSLISFIKANYPSNNVLAIYDVTAFLASPEDENVIKRVAALSGAKAVFSNNGGYDKVRDYMVSVLDFNPLQNLPDNSATFLPSLSQYLNNDSIVSHYQSIMALGENNKTVAYEALARSKKPSLLGNPEILFNYAAHSQLFSEIDFACIKAGLSSGFKPPKGNLLFLNVQPRSLTDINFPEKILSLVNNSGMRPSEIVLELTEQREVLNERMYKRAIRQLKKEGFIIAIDDFGEGNANLEMILNTSPNIIKISGKIIQHVENLEAVRSIIKGIAKQNRAANIKTVAEFIETKKQAEILRDLGVDYGQGWFFSQPKPAIELNRIR